ncbi:MAG: methionyl-tRNA formyltransferase [Eubacteriales bacterium]|nr:methionyl-tRNA formyltransferase [Eubacteriales bacterium]
MKNKIIFFGTPDFSVATLKALYENKNTEILAVVTKIDKKSGRGEKVTFSKVKEYALQKNITILQPKNIKEDYECIYKLKQYNADFFIVVAYGQILSQTILKIPKKACLNGHASLLPKYRGASPIQSALLNGDDKTGVSIMLMEEKLDAGDILKSIEVSIEKKETSKSLFDKLAIFTKDAMIDVIENYDYYYEKRIKQDETKATFVYPIKKEDALINFDNNTNIQIERQIRAMNPWPGAYTFLFDKKSKIWDAQIVSTDEIKKTCEEDIEEIIQKQNKLKVNIFFTKKNIYAICKEGFLQINELQIESKQKMKAIDFINGYCK